MNEKPEYVKNFKKPVNTEIKKIGEHYYLYSRHSVYDPRTQKMRKKSGKVLGKITESGFFESNARKVENTKQQRIDYNGIVNVEFGASYYFYAYNMDILNRLERYFPRHAKEIFAMAIARAIGENAFRRFDIDYHTSILPFFLGDSLELDVSKNARNSLIDELGSMRGSICSYMKEDLSGKDRLILIDGHRILSSSETLSDAMLGYDSRCRHSRQVNILYVFCLDEKEGMPSFYKEFAGSVLDSVALPSLLEETGISKDNLTVVADKGFSSIEDIDAIIEDGMHYIVAVRRGCKDVSVPSSLLSYSDVFTFRDRSVYYKTFSYDNRNYHLYYDMALANAETLAIVNRNERSNAAIEGKIEKEEARRRRKKPKLTDIELEELKASISDALDSLSSKESVGTFILSTDRKELSAKDVYETYKRRQEIELSFKSYDNTLSCTASYMRSHEGMECWLFINHIALQMEYRMLNRISSLGLTGTYSFKDAIKHLSSIRANKIDDKWHVCAITGKTRKFYQDLGLDFPLSLNTEP